MAGETDLRVCAEVAEFVGLLPALDAHSVHLVLLDLGVNAEEGLRALERVRAMHPALPVIVLLSQDNRHYTECALKTGAHGCVGTHDDLSGLRRAIRCVLAGQVCYPRLPRAEVGAGNLARASCVGCLDVSPTRREREVLMHLGCGRSTRQIADHLHLSIKTVQTYALRLQDKLGIAGMARLAQYAALHLAGYIPQGESGSTGKSGGTGVNPSSPIPLNDTLPPMPPRLAEPVFPQSVAAQARAATRPRGAHAQSARAKPRKSSRK